mmetsp:Transcript_52205/g.149607  ORF Transcript_52205/g.149607 Transcript_52205/m.149607 type:complete len:200 (+) Transcript_52205:167-766(+)
MSNEPQGIQSERELGEAPRGRVGHELLQLCPAQACKRIQTSLSEQSLARMLRHGAIRGVPSQAQANCQRCMKAQLLLPRAATSQCGTLVRQEHQACPEEASRPASGVEDLDEPVGTHVSPGIPAHSSVGATAAVARGRWWEGLCLHGDGNIEQVDDSHKQGKSNGLTVQREHRFMLGGPVFGICALDGLRMHHELVPQV